MKKCTKCETEKPLSGFGKHAMGAGGLRAACRECCRSEAKARYAANPEKHRVQLRASRARNPDRTKQAQLRNHVKHQERRKAACQMWREQHPEAASESSKRWRLEHPAEHKASKAKREQVKREATPLWADPWVTRGMYELARVFRSVGLDVQVDHAVPLQHPLVRGLHTAENLELRLAHENNRKGNRTWENAP